MFRLTFHLPLPTKVIVSIFWSQWPPADILTHNIAKMCLLALGHFAEPHINKQDAGAALTVMTFVLSIPENYSLGIFAYHNFKLFIKLEKISIVYFTGLHCHGRTMLSPPHGEVPHPSAYCLTIICYPNAWMMHGNSRNPLVLFQGFDIITKILCMEVTIKRCVEDSTRG